MVDIRMQVASALALLVFAAGSIGCNSQTCRTQSDCDFGSYCIREVGSGIQSDGVCQQDCLSHEDCTVPDDQVFRPICTNEGRCRVDARPPRLRVFEPEEDEEYNEGTRTIRVSGEVETAAMNVLVTASVRGRNGCGSGLPVALSVENPSPGVFATVPFVLDGVPIDSGFATVFVNASIQGSDQSAQIRTEVQCPDCARITMDSPTLNSSTPGLELPSLRGTIAPNTVPQAIWRVRSAFGDVFDGQLSVVNGTYGLDRLPLFAGSNRIEVVVSGVGAGLGEARCSTLINSAVARERGLRGLLLWDGPTSDLDIHVIGPGGRFGELGTTLTSRSPTSLFGGEVVDDFDGLGPEVVTIDPLPDGIYGIAVEPVFDAEDPGSTAFLRLLYDGRPLTIGPIGPAHISSDLGQLWIAGALEVQDGAVTWREVDQIVDAVTPPTQTPEFWPQLY